MQDSKTSKNLKNWNIINKHKNGEDVVKTILKSRGLTDTADIEEFINPKSVKEYLKELPKEFKASLKAAKKLIENAIENNQHIVIHGDYDADGICATSILYNYFKHEMGYDRTLAFIPNRFEHGYGLSKASTEAILNLVKEQNLNEHAQENDGIDDSILIITVDSGITSVEEAEYIKKLGHKLIITDHHQKPEVLPNADVIVWNDKVVGATIAWILSLALGSKNTKAKSIAATATVTDLYELKGFNRALVLEGLEILNINPPLGIKSLLKASGIKDDSIDTRTLGWQIGPRLNATGRIKDASHALELFTIFDENAAYEKAFELNKINQERQNKTLDMYKLAADFTEDETPHVIVSAHPDYHEGIIGLVAARLAQKHYRPAIVVSLEDGVGKGSVRSIEGINIIEILRNFDDLFLNLGGHPMAAGFSIEEKNISKLQDELLNYFEENVSDELFVPSVNVDLELDVSNVDMDLLFSLKQLEPFGTGNSEPLFASRGLGITSINWVGRNQNHVILKLFNKGNTYKAIMFNALDNETASNLKEGEKIDLVYKLAENKFNGNTYLDLHIQDLKIV